jgi:hypothetical protein
MAIVVQFFDGHWKIDRQLICGQALGRSGSTYRNDIVIKIMIYFSYVNKRRNIPGFPEILANSCPRETARRLLTTKMI